MNTKRDKNEYFNYINIAYAFDNIYYYITHVSMKSVMMNQNKNTFIKFYILISENIYNEQKEVIDKISKDYFNCNITYFLIEDEFKEFSSEGTINRTTAIYYRLFLQNLLPNEKKILYLDCDTIVYKDLYKLYNYDIKDKYYIGEYEGKALLKYGKNLKDFINSGVILINLENLRKDNIFPKIYDFLKENNMHLLYLDQDAINVVCNKKNGFFPSDYISSGVCDLNVLKKLNKYKNFERDKIKNLKEPYIFHFKIYKKPWHGIARGIQGMICYDFFHRFYEYARKTNYYFEILEKFKVFQEINSTLL